MSAGARRVLSSYGVHRERRLVTAVVAVALAGLIAVPAAAAQTARTSGTSAPAGKNSCPWVTSTAPISQRVAQLMGSMSLSQKISMVEGHGTSNPYVFYTPAISSLCIPAFGLEDGPAGVADGLTGVTQLPAGVALAATWDPSLAQSVRPGDRRRGVRQGRQRQPRPDREHRPGPALGPVVRGAERGPVPQLRPGRPRDRRRAGPGRDVAGQALRRVQPGDLPQHARPTTSSSTTGRCRRSTCRRSTRRSRRRTPRR